ncbi:MULTISPECIES: glutamine--fructose-6-phosphate transaminase (isomerizing) [unclassified Iodidimonas]|uniref:glutamine--fructose-6-phosphate transaminase (isomerizing) n=1 Tax=unclassified Iodidimonas TaxID=2626145 RepID=UPI00248218B9|nr:MULTISPECIES: glutamine--fructose-6-phosphate transaminase (isomerizing) [unclassified Iodidimonas]
MCGIIGIVGLRPVAGRLMDALRRLEYRGYDSAGIALIEDGRIARRRASGKLDQLDALLARDPLDGLIGIGHTRWATHGGPSTANAHPHIGRHVAVVHNGIIENFKALREELIAAGHQFTSETDTEVIAHLLSDHLAAGIEPRLAVKQTLDRLEGAFALAILIDGKDRLMYGARRGSPLVVGLADGECFLGSDAIALAGLCNRICYLEEGDWAELHGDHFALFDAAGEPVERPLVHSSVSGVMVDKGNHRHFMLKEIYEQPTVVGQTLGSYLDPLAETVAVPGLCFDPKALSRITLIACGTSYYAAMIAQYWLEHYAKIPVTVDIASEFRYRQPVMTKGGLSLFISQSGETADTLAALRHCKAEGQITATIVNVAQSTMAREADMVFPTHAGPEIGVASTKAFTCQLAVLAALSIAFGVARGHIDQTEQAALVRVLNEIPSRMSEALQEESHVREIAADLSRARDVLYLGRGADYPLALEGALKLKEISYIHAEGYAAGEIKHGPIALIDPNVPVIVIAPKGPLFEKTVSNMEEVIARGGKVILMSCKEGIASQGRTALNSIEMPAVHPLGSPLVYAIPVQLLAYHTAVLKGTDVDQPRNLAKSVTVE